MDKVVSFLKKFIPSIPNWVTGFNAHWMFGYGLVYTFPYIWVIALAELVFGVKEFYIDKHFETTPQSFVMNLKDFGSYTLGVVLALLAHHFMR